MSNEKELSVEEVLNEMSQSETLAAEDLPSMVKHGGYDPAIKVPSMSPIDILNSIQLLLQTYALNVQTGSTKEELDMIKSKINKFVAEL